MSVLGRDILNLFSQIVDRQGDTACLRAAAFLHNRYAVRSPVAVRDRSEERRAEVRKHPDDDIIGVLTLASHFPGFASTTLRAAEASTRANSFSNDARDVSPAVTFTCNVSTSSRPPSRSVACTV